MFEELLKCFRPFKRAAMMLMCPTRGLLSMFTFRLLILVFHANRNGRIRAGKSNTAASRAAAAGRGDAAAERAASLPTAGHARCLRSLRGSVASSMAACP
ncbi:hypothetical protein EYF80_001916 [Liparis tanakae]|uniref:Uncharacterized protein n=1 Tax=Liparis tanakae TaxID=230148 RepID=A0A4Z2JFB3_9TELE|nr:hypothetical protein EYF80_001916 [Liparis tanakae]